MKYFIPLMALGLIACGGDGAREGSVSRKWDGGSYPVSAYYDDFKPTPEQYPIPDPILVVKRTDIHGAKYPAIDIHFHGRDWSDSEQQLQLMDRHNVAMIVNLDGYSGERLELTLRNAADSEGRLITFARVNWEGIDEPEWPEREAVRLAESFRTGAMGLKISKRLGMVVRYADGRYLMPDDLRLDLIWEVCAEFGLPVMIHTSDAPARFMPIGPNNERYEAGMWRSSPVGNYYDTDIPDYTVLLKAQENLFARHPKTIFIGAHTASRAWDLTEVSRLLDAYPNLYVDINARLQELGRQPYTCRRWMLKYQDRILFGTDGNPSRDDEFWTPHWRFLETDDEYFNHPAQMLGPKGAGLQGRWMIYGVFLPDDVLQKMYYRNALKLLPPQAREDFERLYDSME